MQIPHLSGFTADGMRYVRIRYGSKTAVLPWAEFAGASSRIFPALAAKDVVIVNKAQRSALLNQASELSEFPPGEVALSSGWCGLHYVLPDGTIYSPPDVNPPEILFPINSGRCAQAGSLRRWKTGVAERLATHHIPAFALMAVFAPLILTLAGRTDNFSIELTGPPGTGKSTALRYAASVYGPIAGSDRYWQTFDSTRGGIETMIKTGADMPIILDETNLAAAGQGAQAQSRALLDFSFQVASGQGRSRLGDLSLSSVSTIALLSSNQSLREIASAVSTAVANAALDRLRPLHVPETGIFDQLPADAPSGGALAASITQVALANYGKASRKFIKKLVIARSQNEATLRSEIAERMQEFRQLAGVSENDGSACRVADIYGIIMVAGRLAKRFHVLPSSFDPIAIALACYRNSLAVGQQSTAVERILSVLDEPGVVTIDPQHLVSMTTAEMDASVAFVLRQPSRRPQLLFWPYSFRRRLGADFVAVLRDPGVQNMLMHEQGRPTSKRAVRANVQTKDRFYCFELPHGRA